MTNHPLPYDHRRRLLKERAGALGLSAAELARRMGYADPEGSGSYVRRVLGGLDVSKPMLDRVEDELNREEGRVSA